MFELAWYERMKASPRAMELFEIAVNNSREGRAAELKELVDLIFVPESEEHQRHNAIFWGEIKPGEPYDGIMTEEEQRAQLFINVAKFVGVKAHPRSAA